MSNSQSGGNGTGSNVDNNQAGTTGSSCAVRAATLPEAKQIYTDQCSSLPRQDCDDVNGQWYCSSAQINNATPAGLVAGNGSPDTGDSSVGASGSTSSSRVPDTSASGSSSNTSLAEESECLDVDGDGWGWNGASCRVNAINDRLAVGGDTGNTSHNDTADSASSEEPVSVVASGVCVDPDGDGWGWNGESCRVTAATVKSVPHRQFSASDITDLVLLTGQSNALGANTAFDAALDTPDDHVFAFTANGWQRADLHQIWDRGWHPRNHPETDPSNNLLLHFGKRLAALDSDRIVGFVLVSAPGAAISNWDYNGEFYRKVRAKALDAINQLPHKYQLDGMLWHQGETDAVDSPVYSAKLKALIANFRSENWFSSGEPFICGEIAKRGGVNNRLNELNDDGDSSTACISAAGVATKSDNSHFTAEGLRELGKRYADRFYSMTR